MRCEDRTQLLLKEGVGAYCCHAEPVVTDAGSNPAEARPWVSPLDWVRARSCGHERFRSKPSLRANVPRLGSLPDRDRAVRKPARD